MANKFEWVSWADGKWAINSMKLEEDVDQHNIAGTLIELDDNRWHCTLSFTLPAGKVGNFVKAKAVVEYLIRILLKQF